MRSPSMVRWPAQVEPGSISHEPWAFWDVLPTLAEVAGASKRVPEGLDGRSFLPTLLGSPPAEGERAFFFTGKGDWAGEGRAGGEYSSLLPSVRGADKGGEPTTYAVRAGPWKAVGLECHGTPSPEDPMALYNLETDPFEEHDVASTAEGQSRLSTFRKWLASEDLSCKCFQCPN